MKTANTDVIALDLGVGQSSTKDIYEEYIEDRRLVLDSDVNDSVIHDYVLYILKWNKEDLYLPTDKRKPIYLYINSVGGDAIPGFALVDAIVSSATPVIAVGVGLIASMAYYIFIGCSKRYAFENSVFLQHDGALNISNSNAKAKDSMAFYDNFDARIKDYVLAHTTMTAEKYDEVYGREYYMFPSEAKELGCVDKIIGVDCKLQELFS